MGERKNDELFEEDDPLRYLHVPRRDRVDDDEGITANASTGGTDDNFDREEVKARGDVVPEQDLQ